MKLTLLLLLALIVSVALIIFPDIADQALRLEAFGWVFETRQGAFIVALLVLLVLLWLLRSLTRALFSGPGVAWRSLRMGSRKRREKKLKEALAQWLDNRGDKGVKALKRSRGVLPDWAMDLLQTLATPAKDLPEPGDNKQDELVTALTARIATDPATSSGVDLAIRKAHLHAWLHAHPGAPLANKRLADLAEEEGDWLTCLNLLEAEWKQGKRSAHSVKPRMVRACLELAMQDSEQAMTFLRKAYRLLPDDANVLLAYGSGLQAGDEAVTVQRLWSTYLDKHSNMRVARSLLELQYPDAMRAYRKLEGKAATELNQAQRWLRAELAHAAKLDGLAFEQMQALAEQSGSASAWKSLGCWYEANEAYDKASSCFRQALEK